MGTPGSLADSSCKDGGLDSFDTDDSLCADKISAMSSAHASEMPLRGISFVRVCAAVVVPLAEVRASNKGSATMSECMGILQTLSPLNTFDRKLSKQFTDDMCTHSKNEKERYNKQLEAIGKLWWCGLPSPGALGACRVGVAC